jgi:transcriptional regulator with XRE-family HTH domain
MITPEQLRAARALLGWSAKRLADAAGLATSTVHALERGGIGINHPREIEAARAMLEQAGVVFVEEDDGLGAGVRLARPRRHWKGLRPEELNASNDD